MLSLGCLEELVSSHAKPLLENIAHKHASSITVLGLASIKDYPDDYFITDLNITLLKPLKHLQSSTSLFLAAKIARSLNHSLFLRLVMMFGNTLLMSSSFDETKLQIFRGNEINPLDSSTGTRPLPIVNNYSEKSSSDVSFSNATLMFVVS
ncbi:hypothetical protein J6590_088561 [Homalodisca vitripennis]|nr:hypothetical protein J6590_088561 [Homalodisca vitripennis]